MIICAIGRCIYARPAPTALAGQENVAGRRDIGGEYRTRLFHAIRDFTADAYGGWQLVTMLQTGGGLYAQRLVARKHYPMDDAKALALKPAGLAED